MRGLGSPRLVRVLTLWGRRVGLSVQWDWHDCWVGVYWDLRYDDRFNGYLWRTDRRLYIWLCLLPTVPLCVRLPWPWREKRHGK